MATAPAPGGPDAAAMMTLSAIAYYDDVSGLLANASYATNADWTLVWGPAVSNDFNRLFVAQSQSTGRFAVAIRGSETGLSWDTIYNWAYDLDVFTQSPWPLFNDQSAMISSGAYTQVTHLLTMTSNGTTLAAYLAQLPQGQTLLFTGHSLGANLATVLASWASHNRGPAGDQPDPATQVYTFACPSPGNTAFATAYDARFPSSWRYWNSYDIVPLAWADLPGQITIYEPLNINCPWSVEIRAVEAILDGSELYYDSAYDQTNGDGTELPGQPFTPPLLSPSISNQFSAWDLEAAYQHGSNVYLGLLGAAPVNPPTSVPSASPAAALLPPRAQAAAAAPRVGATPLLARRSRSRSR